MKQVLPILLLASAVWNVRGAGTWESAFQAPLLSAVPVQTPSAPPIEWQRAYGGTDQEWPRVIKQIPGGGLIVGVISYSEPSGTKVSPTYGTSDYWIIRLDANGDVVWERSFGGTRYDYVQDIVFLPDGSLLIGGTSSSPISGNKSTSSTTGDFWLVCLDGQGNKLWERSIGGDNPDGLLSMDTTRDGGVILGGSSTSGVSRDKSAAHYGEEDFWIVRLDAAGNVLWDRSYGGEGRDWFPVVRPTADGGFVVVGSSFSFPSGNKTTEHFGPAGWSDFWVIRLDAQGHKLWERNLGGTNQEIAKDIQQMHDGGFLVFGESSSDADGNKSAPSHGTTDLWLVRLDREGNIVWDRALGGSQYEFAAQMIKTWDGGYLLGACSNSKPGGTLTTTNYGIMDLWIIRLDREANVLWQQSCGGSSFDQYPFLTQTEDGGYAMVAESISNIDGNKTVSSFGSSSAWLVKLRPDVVSLRFPTAIGADGFRMQLSGPTNVYTVDYSSNLQDWQPLQSVTLTNNSMAIIDVDATNATRRFYRARQ